MLGELRTLDLSDLFESNDEKKTDSMAPPSSGDESLITNEAEEIESDNVTASTNTAVEIGTLRIFFPDMGAAALARRDWKMGYVS